MTDNKVPNIHEVTPGTYAVCVWVESSGQFQAPLDAETRKLTGCHAEFARSLHGFGGMSLADARNRAQRLYGYQKMAR